MHNCGGKPQKMAPTHRDKELVILNIIAVATTTNPHIMYIHNVDAVWHQSKHVSRTYSKCLIQKEFKFQIRQVNTSINNDHKQDIFGGKLCTTSIINCTFCLLEQYFLIVFLYFCMTTTSSTYYQRQWHEKRKIWQARRWTIVIDGRQHHVEIAPRGSFIILLTAFKVVSEV